MRTARINRGRRLPQALLGLALIAAAFVAPSAAQASFGIKSVTVKAANADGTVDLEAASHPFSYTVGITMNQDQQGSPEGILRDLVVDLPPGLVGNPLSLPRCARIDFSSGAEPHCPGNTQIGIARARIKGLGETTSAIYNLAPSIGTPLSIGFSVDQNNSFQDASIRTGEGYGGRVSDITIPTTIEIQSVTETIWGVPQDERHDAERRCISSEGTFVKGCSAGILAAPFLSLPTSCTGPLITTASADSVEEPGEFQSKSVPSLNDGGNPEGLNSCQQVPFDPTVTVQPETNVTDSPSGLAVNIGIPQNQDPKGLSTANLKDTVISFPPGVAVNPSAADGLAACSAEQVALEKPGPAQCPAQSKVGSVEIESPLVDHPLDGAVYLAKQGENPFGSLIALYLAVDDPATGVVVKLAGKVEPDPVTGQLKTTFLENPQLPFDTVRVHIFGGPRSSLTTPSICGTYSSRASLTPWTSPESAAVPSFDSFAMTTAPGGGPCPSSEAQKPDAPSFEAGTTAPLAGAYSPFVLKLSRENGSQYLKALNVTLPPGLVGKLAGVAECSEPQIAAAEARSKPGEGALEQANPSCPSSSEVGTVTVGAGSGAPFYVQGHAYLAGAYKGAPLSLAIITPAVAGPFDLGVVVVRSALYVDETSAQITAKTDPLPTIMQGIPLDIRSVAVNMDRPQFTLNPTNCSAKAVSAEAISPIGSTALVAQRFQVGGCQGLGFSPKLSLRFSGSTARRSHPAFRATLTRPEGQANFGKVSVTLPSTQFIDPNHIGNPCTRPEFAEGKCPPISELGVARAYTPLLAQPLTGKVYFRANGGARTLPDLVVDLNGQIHVVLVGFVDSIVHGESSRVRTTFAQNPDAPVSKVVLELFGGKRGVLVNSQNLCRTRVSQTAIVKMTGQNGKTHNVNPAIANSCPKRKARR